MNFVDENAELLKPGTWLKGDELLALHAKKLRAAHVPPKWLQAAELKPKEAT